MAYSIEKSILKKIGNAQGCSRDELTPILPGPYQSADVDPGFFLHEPLLHLMKWGLIQVFDGNRLVEIAEFEGNPSGFRERQDMFFLSPEAVQMESALGLKLTGGFEPIFGEPIKAKSWPQLFVLMPFSPQLRPVFDDHIKKVAAEMNLVAARADDFFSTGSIIYEIWSAIYHAQVVVADCSGRNPNVFYEIGIAHTLGKKTILIAQTIDDVPFDLRSYRVIVYEYTPRGMQEFEVKLKATLASE